MLSTLDIPEGLEFPPNAQFYQPRGRIISMFHWIENGRCPYGEVLLEGPAGTGKSRGHGEFIYRCMESFPLSRHLVVRKTRKSLTDSWMDTWENDVLGPGHRMLEGPKPTGRHQYEHSNGSVCVMGGMDDPGKHYSTRWDTVSYEEAIWSDVDEWERFGRALRSNRMPFQLMIGLVNPDIPRHFLNLRCEPAANGAPPLMRRIITRHADNPSLTPQYLARLERMTGVRRRRLYLGEWCQAEGAIFPEYDKYRHMIHRKDVPFHPAIHGINTDKSIKIKAFYGSVDWGTRDPGVFLVWGMDTENNLYLVAQIYKTQQAITYWADQAVKLDKIYKFDRIFCDPENKGMIDLFNAVIGQWRNRNGEAVAVKAKNAWHAGIESVRERLIGHAGKPSIYICYDTLLDGRDEVLAEHFDPFCLEHELEAYVYKKDVDGKPILGRGREAEDPTCKAHAIDATRYVCLSLLGVDERPTLKAPKFEPGTGGYEGRHWEVEGFEDSEAA